MYCASIALALFTFAYMLRGGALLFGSINLTPVFLLITIACAAVHIVVTGKIRFQLIWADLALVGFALLMFVNSSSEAGADKSMRFIALVLVPYFLARYILVDFGQVKRFLYTALAIITVIALGGFASSFLPQPIASLLPYESSEWGQRLIFAEANPIAVGMAIMIGMMVYVGLSAGRGRISWAIPCLVTTGIMLYTLLLVGTRGAIVASFGALIVAIVATLATRRFKGLPVLIIALCGVGFIFYNAFAGALVPEPQPETPAVVAAAQEVPTPTAEPVEPTPEPTQAPDDTDTEPEEEPTPEPEPTHEPTPEPEPTPDPEPTPEPTPEPEPTAPPIQLPRVELPNQDRFDTLVDATTISGWTSEDTLKNRVVLFREAVAMFRENPILGAGAAGMEIDGAAGLEIYAHNIFLETAGELGIVGLALLAVALAFTLRSLWKFFITMDQGHPNYYIVLAVFMALTGLFIQKQFSTSLASHKDIVAFAAIILNLPILLNIPASAVQLSGLRSKLPPQLRFLAPAKDSVPIDDADEPSA